MKILFASHSYFNPSLVVGSYHLSRCFAAGGHEVLHLSTPVTLAHWFQRDRDIHYSRRLELCFNGGRKTEDGVMEYVPFSLVPWQVARNMTSSSFQPYLQSAVGLKKILREHGMLEPDVLLVDEPRLLGLEKMVRARSLFYRATDLYSDLKSDPGYSMCERFLVDKCHGLVATSEPVAEHLRQMAPDRPLLLLENGVDLEHFARPRACPFEYAGIPEPRLVYLGAIDHRFDFDALPVAVQAGFQIVLIGPLSAGISPVLLQQPGVHWIGERAYEVAPAYLQHAQAGFLPMNQHPSNAGRSPMKLYEYGAAGLPVVARGTAELSRRQDSFVLLYASVEELAIRLSEARKRTRVTSDIIQGSSWTEKSARLLEFVRKFEGKA